MSGRENLTRALHRHVCGTEWDEWNQPCDWAGEDWDPANGPETCAYVGEVGIEPAVLAWVEALADDEALLTAICHRQGLSESDGDIWFERGEFVSIVLRDLAAALTAEADQ